MIMGKYQEQYGQTVKLLKDHLFGESIDQFDFYELNCLVDVVNELPEATRTELFKQPLSQEETKAYVRIAKDVIKAAQDGVDFKTLFSQS